METMMIRSSNSSGASWARPFLAGVLTTTTIVYFLPWARERFRSAQRRWREKPKEDLPMDSPDLDLRMIRKAEAAIRRRTSALTIVVERCTNDHNYSAILRTAEALGVQRVWIIAPPTSVEESSSLSDQHENGNNGDNNTNNNNARKISQEDKEARSEHHVFARKAQEWLDVREFPTTASCVAELRRTKHTLWVTDLSQTAVSLDFVPSNKKLPVPLAIVFGTEAVGCTQAMLAAADERVYFPLRGFADSLNLSVATALVVHQLFILDPSLEGNMPEAERRQLRTKWYAKLAQQRILTRTQKKHRAKLTLQVTKYRTLQERLARNEITPTSLSPELLEKLPQLPQLEQELEQLESQLEQDASRAVQPWVENPPEPLADLRRHDEHRTWFGGKKTRLRNEEIWNDMPATTNLSTQQGTSSLAFRTQAAATATN